MKKLISILIIFAFLSQFVFASIIEDEFVIKTLDPGLKVKKVAIESIEDEFAIKTLDSSLKIKTPCPETITDEFALKSLNPDLKIKKPINEKITDEFFEKNSKEIVKPLVKNYLKVENVKVSSAKYYSTKNKIKEGDYVDFILNEDFVSEDKTYKKDSIIKARIENISKNEAYGVPADMIIDNFILPDGNRINGTIDIRGANRSLWVYPCVYILSSFFGLGLFFIPIRGGHAKLKPNRVYIIGD